MTKWIKKIGTKLKTGLKEAGNQIGIAIGEYMFGGGR